MQLLDHPANRTPPGAEVGAVVTRDGVTLRSASWPRPSGADTDRGTVLLLQGRAEFIEKYFEIVAALGARGFAVTTFDWRGQGRSDRALPNRHLGHVRDFADFRLDYEAVRATVAASQRVTVLAHSMGGAVALAGASEGWLDADRLVCTNPMLGLSIVKAERLARLSARLLVRAGFGTRVVPGGVDASISTLPFPGNRLSRDQGRYDRNAALAHALDWAAIGSPTIGWLDSAYAAMDRLARPGVAASIPGPALMVLSERDRVCSARTMTRFAEGLTQGRVLLLPEAEHEILMETDTVLATFWDAFDAFVRDGERPRRVAAL